MTRRCALLLAFMALPLAATAQKPPVKPTKPPPEPARVDLQPPRAPAPILGQAYVGQTAPDFELDDHHGASVRLSRLRGDWLLLVFSDRARDLVQLRGVESRLRTFGARLVSVSHEKVSTLRALAERDSVRGRLLADVTGQVSASYGLYDFQRDQVLSAMLLLDRDGTVRWIVIGALPPADALVRLTEFTITGL